MKHAKAITASEAARSFSNLLNQVYYQGKTFEIKRGREIIAKVMPASPATKSIAIAALNDFFDSLAVLDAEGR